MSLEKVPNHIAIIMDGNGRWAKQRKLPRFAGHKAGVDAVRRTLQACMDHGVKAVTLFAFSSENWNRPQDEVSKLMELLLVVLKQEIKKLNKKEVRIRFVGDVSRFNEKLQQIIADAQVKTAQNDKLHLTIAANYGGQWDIVEATKKIASQVASGQLQVDEINDQLFENNLATAGLPMPDLLIRTSGETRISNFMLWQLAYAEMYFCDLYWPEFGEKELLGAIDYYAGRERRFGVTSEQLED